MLLVYKKPIDRDSLFMSVRKNESLVENYNIERSMFPYLNTSNYCGIYTYTGDIFLYVNGAGVPRTTQYTERFVFYDPHTSNMDIFMSYANTFLNGSTRLLKDYTTTLYKYMRCDHYQFENDPMYSMCEGFSRDEVALDIDRCTNGMCAIKSMEDIKNEWRRV